MPAAHVEPEVRKVDRHHRREDEEEPRWHVPQLPHRGEPSRLSKERRNATGLFFAFSLIHFIGCPL
jgi:hypothetical protein